MLSYSFLEENSYILKTLFWDRYVSYKVNPFISVWEITSGKQMKVDKKCRVSVLVRKLKAYYPSYQLNVLELQHIC